MSEDFSKAKRGAIVSVASSSVQLNLRLDADIIDYFKEQVNQAGGGNYQLLINEALHQHINNEDTLLATTLRQVIRDELKLIKVA